MACVFRRFRIVEFDEKVCLIRIGLPRVDATAETRIIHMISVIIGLKHVETDILAPRDSLWRAFLSVGPGSTQTTQEM